MEKNKYSTHVLRPRCCSLYSPTCRIFGIPSNAQIITNTSLDFRKHFIGWSEDNECFSLFLDSSYPTHRSA